MPPRFPIPIPPLFHFLLPRSSSYICQSCLAAASRPPCPPSSYQHLGRYSSTESAAAQPTTRPHSLRHSLRRSRLRARRQAAVSKTDSVHDHPDFTVRFFEQDEDGNRRELDDEDAYNDSLNGLPPFPNIDDWFDNLRGDEDLAPYAGLIGSFQRGIQARLRGVTDPAEKERRVGEYMAALEARIGSLAMTAEELEELEEANREIDAIGTDDEFLEEFERQDRAESREEMRRRNKRKRIFMRNEAGGREGGGEGEVEVEWGGGGEEARTKAKKKPAKCPPPQIPAHEWSMCQHLKIATLNARLAKHARDEDRTALTPRRLSITYKAYYNARLTMLQKPDRVPASVWALLWDLFSTEQIPSEFRMDRVAQLASDMSRAGVPLSQDQLLLAIEAMSSLDRFAAGAVDLWRRMAPTLGIESAARFGEFWELGARMHARAGDMAQAERALARLLAAGGDQQQPVQAAAVHTVRAAVHLLQAYLSRDSAEDDGRAWDAYRRIRDDPHLSTAMKIEDYDEIISSLLAARQVEYGLHAFVDMMTETRLDLAQRWVDGQRPLPASVANKFFFGKWKKQLIMRGDLDGAREVIRFMGRRRIRAAPVHVNALIGAWQRRGGERDLRRAEEAAWGMIYARQTFVRIRSSLPSLGLPERVRFVYSGFSRQRHASRRGRDEDSGDDATAAANADGEDMAHDDDLLAGLPGANLETFQLLADSYRVRGLHSRQPGLWDAMRKCELRPDTFFMNKMMESYEQDDLVDEGRAFFLAVTDRYGVAPDVFTFDTLWRSLTANRFPVLSPAARETDVSRARLLFAELMEAAAAQMAAPSSWSSLPPPPPPEPASDTAIDTVTQETTSDVIIAPAPQGATLEATSATTTPHGATLERAATTAGQEATSETGIVNIVLDAISDTPAAASSNAPPEATSDTSLYTPTSESSPKPRSAPLTPHSPSHPHVIFTSQLGRTILHTFRKLEDRAGLTVALRTLHKVFGYLPNDITVVEMVMGSSRLSIDSYAGRQKIILGANIVAREVNQLRAELEAEPTKRGERSAAVPEGGEMLSRYLERKFAPEGGIGEEEYRAVAEQMGAQASK